MSRVLVVDDDPGTVRGMRTLLEMDGFDTFATTSSADALEALGRERFDFVITDLEMPRVHGVEIVRHGGGARHERVRERDTEVGRRQVHGLSSHPSFVVAAAFWASGLSVTRRPARCSYIA